MGNPISRQRFFDGVRASLFSGKLLQPQVDCMEAILKEWESRKLTDLRQLAYILATALHETGKTMQPVPEDEKGRGRDYGKKLKMGGGPGQRIAYSTPDEIYYGRGLVQLTWFENYNYFSKILNINLLNNPDLALHLDVSVKILFEGMLRGSFTGKRLTDYFNAQTEDWIHARKIINGCDCAERIAGFAHSFYQALQ